jgi:hypothetical protein
MLRGGLWLCVVLGLGCASSRRPIVATDTGTPPPTDVGIVLRDTGAPPNDAGSPTDAYTPPRVDAWRPGPVDAWSPPLPDAWTPPRVDAWSPPACSITVSMTQFTSLTPGCFTRCQRATLTAYNACAPNDGTCQNGALNADPTPTIGYDINGMASTMPLNCAQCFSLQELHCAFVNGCASQTYAFAICDPTTMSCTSQTTALNNCWTRNQTAIGTCINDPSMGAIACFAP